jgi:phage I-like protein
MDVFHVELMANETGLIEGVQEVRLTPWGQVRSTRGEFTVDEETFAEMERSFAQQGVDLPIDYEHQLLGGDFAAPDGRAPAAGWIKKLIAKAGVGIFGLVEWTQRAREAIRAKEYRYLSPVIVLRKSDRKAIGLHSAALTNKPAIERMDALAAKDRSGSGIVTENEPMDGKENAMAGETLQLIGQLAEAVGAQANAADAPGSLRKIKEEVGKLKGALTALSSVKTALGLKEGDAVEAIAAKAAALSANAARVDGLEKELATFKVEAAKAQVKERLAPFVAANQITPAMLPQFEALAAKDWPACEAICKTLPVAAPTGQTRPPAGGAPMTGTANEEELIANAVKEHKGNYGEAIAVLQVALKEPFIAQGLTHKAANAACAEKYPRIFGTGG